MMIVGNDVVCVHETRSFWSKKRYLVVLMAFLGFFNVYALRVNLSVAIVAMTEIRTSFHDNGTVSYDQYFDWNSKQKGLVLSSFFYGYICTQFVGGYVASKIGGNIVFAAGIGVTALLTLVTPWAANTGFYLLLVVRIVEGIFEGLTFPCMYDMWSKWAPPLERSRMAGFAMAGNYVGTVVSMPVSGLLATHFGWESVFYVFGSIALIWCVLWLIIIKESPQKDPYMSDEERNYIMTSLGNQWNHHPKFSDTPWTAILTSKPVWAIIVAHFAESWGFFTLLTELPSFFKDVMRFDVTKSGFIAAIPYLTLSILLFISGFLADWLQIKKYLTTTQVRRYFNCPSFLAQTVFMMIAAYSLHPILSVLCLTIGVGLGAFSLSGFAVNHLDIAPQYASILMGISNTFGTIPGIVSPLLTGVIVTSPDSSDEWKYVFFISAGIYLLGSIFYWFYASGELQPWAVKKSKNIIQQ